MDFYSWIKERIDEWLKTGRSESQLARAIGINPATLNAYKNQSRGIPQDEKIKNAFISFYKITNPEVYEVLNVPRPIDPRSALSKLGLPAGFIEATMAAHSEYTEQIAERGISADSPEADEIRRRVLEKHGIVFTVTR